jgi:glutathione S-transferase
MKLYYTPGVCSLAPHVALLEIGNPFTLEKVDIKNKITASGKNYLDISSRGAVPLLELDNGETIGEGVVILQYLADNAPESNLAPTYGTMSRVRLNEWLNFITTDLHKSFFVFFYNGGETAQKLYQAKLDKHFTQCAEHLSKNNYIMGDNFSIADPYLYTILTWAHKLNMNLSRWPSLIEFMARMESRPSVQKAIETEGLKPTQTSSMAA